MNHPIGEAGMGRISRRQFLKGSGYAALGIAATSNAWLVPGAAARARRGPCRPPCGNSGNKWNSLAKRLNGQLLRPNDPDYATTGLSENTIVASIRPAAIALCADTEDVRTCILWAQHHRVPLVAQSGGHSYGGYSTTEGLMISVRPINGVSLDRGSGIATIGSGIQLGDLYNTLFSEGVFMPAGRCTSVGIAGFVLGGGFGFETRQFGLTSDLMVETEIVTADGDVLTCNATENPDLFWACRGGGGGNFGINTSFTMQTIPIVPTTYGRLIWSLEDIEASWAAVQEVAITAPSAMGMRNGIARSRMALGAPSMGQVSALFIYFGSEDEARDILAPAINAAPPTEVTILTGTIADATAFVAEESSPNAFLAKSAYAEVPFPPEGVSKVVDFFNRWPDSSRAGVFALHSVGGVSNDVGRTTTAYVHRGAQAAFEFEADWFEDATPPQIAENVAWIEALGEAVAPYFNGEAYQNFIDPTLIEWPAQYYAENFNRLVEVKRRYDRENIFHFPQSIPV
jgi:FAD/FMN-containing dehydrogenase